MTIARPLRPPSVARLSMDVSMKPSEPVPLRSRSQPTERL
jgi:hypothetical protein